MLGNPFERMMHSIICVAVFLGWFSCFFFIALIPGYSALYHSGLILPFLNVVIFLPYAIFAWRVYAKHFAFLSLGHFSFKGLLLPLAALVALTLIYGQFAQPESWMEELPQQPFLIKLMLVVTIILVAPISEEIIFRGFMLNSSIGWGKLAKTLGIVFVSLVFSCVHSQYDSAFTFIYLFAFSTILCVVRINTRSLIMPMVLHGINNSMAVLGLFYFNSAG